MKYIKKIIKRGLIGMTIGVFINQLIFFIIGLSKNFEGTITFKIQSSQFLISCVVGCYCCASSLIFSIEEFSKLKQTIIHLISMSIIYFPLAYYAKWMPKNVMGKIIFIMTYIFIYITIWGFYKIHWNKKVEEINKKIQEKNIVNKN